MDAGQLAAAQEVVLGQFRRDFFARGAGPALNRRRPGSLIATRKGPSGPWMLPGSSGQRIAGRQPVLAVPVGHSLLSLPIYQEWRGCRCADSRGAER